MGNIKFTSQHTGRDDIEAERDCYTTVLHYSLAVRHDWPSRVAFRSAPPISRGSVGFKAEDLHTWPRSPFIIIINLYRSSSRSVSFPPLFLFLLFRVRSFGRKRVSTTRAPALSRLSASSPLINLIISDDYRWITPNALPAGYFCSSRAFP